MMDDAQLRVRLANVMLGLLNLALRLLLFATAVRQGEILLRISSSCGRVNNNNNINNNNNNNNNEVI